MKKALMMLYSTHAALPLQTNAQMACRIWHWQVVASKQVVISSV
jgi:hypothetical protein